MRYFILILLLATPALAVDTASIDRDGVTTAVTLAPVALSGSATDITTGTLNAARLPATYLTGNQSISFAPTGDVSSTGGSGATSLTPAITVAKIQGVSVDNTAPSTNDVFQFNGTLWQHVTPATLKTSLSLNNVENTALSTWAGSANITTLGTIASGTVPVARVSGLPTFPSGTIVGTNDTQTLSAKTLTNPTVSGGVYSQTTATANTISIDANTYAGATLTATGATTVTITNMIAGKYLDFKISSSGGGDVTIATLTPTWVTGAPASITAGKASWFVCKGTGTNTADCAAIKENF